MTNIHVCKNHIHNQIISFHVMCHKQTDRQIDKNNLTTNYCIFFIVSIDFP